MNSFARSAVPWFGSALGVSLLLSGGRMIDTFPGKTKLWLMKVVRSTS